MAAKNFTVRAYQNSNRANASLALAKQASCPRQKRLLPYPSDERGLDKLAV